MDKILLNTAKFKKIHTGTSQDIQINPADINFQIRVTEAMLQTDLEKSRLHKKLEQNRTRNGSPEVESQSARNSRLSSLAAIRFRLYSRELNSEKNAAKKFLEIILNHPEVFRLKHFLATRKEILKNPKLMEIELQKREAMEQRHAQKSALEHKSEANEVCSIKLTIIGNKE